MVQTTNMLALLALLPTLGLASSNHHRGHRHAHAHAKRDAAAATAVTYTTVTAFATVYEDDLPTPLAAQYTPVRSRKPKPSSVASPPPDQPPKPAVKESPVAASSVVESSAVVVPTSSAPAEPAATFVPSPPSGGAGAGPGEVSFKNNCPYDVTIQVVNPTSNDEDGCGPEDDVASGASATRKIRSFGGNDSLKITAKGYSGTTQFEYGYKKGDGTTSKSGLWYNVSLIDCVKDGATNGAKVCPSDYKFSMKASTTAPYDEAAECSTWSSTSNAQAVKNAYLTPYGDAFKAATLEKTEPVRCCPAPAPEDLSLEISIC